jgi:hypothetical protein
MKFSFGTHRMATGLLFGLALMLTLFAAACAYFYFRQDKLLFYPVVNDPGLAAQWRASRVTIPTGDMTVEGWWAENPHSGSEAVVIYFGGNAEDVLHLADSAAQLDARRVLLTNYRGYGGTPGKPDQQAFFHDALVIYDYAVSQPGVSADEVVLMGRSLGSGVATFVAANRPVRGVVLITPFDSIATVAQGHYPYLPVRWLLRSPFPSDEFAPGIAAPVVIIAGADDVLIPAARAHRLYATWAGPKEIHVLDGAGHNDITRHAGYYPLINAFLARR